MKADHATPTGFSTPAAASGANCDGDNRGGRHTERDKNACEHRRAAVRWICRPPGPKRIPPTRMNEWWPFGSRDFSSDKLREEVIASAVARLQENGSCLLNTHPLLIAAVMSLSKLKCQTQKYISYFILIFYEIFYSQINFFYEIFFIIIIFVKFYQL